MKPEGIKEEDSMKAELTVKMKVKDVTIELTLEEVKNLKGALEELTGKIVVPTYIPYIPSNPVFPWDWWKWYEPNTGTPLPLYPTITCSVGNDVSLLVQLT